MRAESWLAGLALAVACATPVVRAAEPDDRFLELLEWIGEADEDESMELLEMLDILEDSEELDDTSATAEAENDEGA